MPAVPTKRLRGRFIHRGPRKLIWKTRSTEKKSNRELNRPLTPESIAKEHMGVISIVTKGYLKRLVKDGIFQNMSEAVNAAYLHLLEKGRYAKYDPTRKKPSTFITVVVSNFFNKKIMEANAKMRRPVAGKIISLSKDAFQEIPSTKGENEYNVWLMERINEDNIQLVQQVVNRLTPKERKLLDYHVTQNLTIKQIADLEGTSRNTKKHEWVLLQRKLGVLLKKTGVLES